MIFFLLICSSPKIASSLFFLDEICAFLTTSRISAASCSLSSSSGSFLSTTREEQQQQLLPTLKALGFLTDENETNRPGKIFCPNFKSRFFFASILNFDFCRS